MLPILTLNLSVTTRVILSKHNSDLVTPGPTPPEASRFIPRRKFQLVQPHEAHEVSLLQAFSDLVPHCCLTVSPPSNPHQLLPHCSPRRFLTLCLQTSIPGSLHSGFSFWNVAQPHGFHLHFLYPNVTFPGRSFLMSPSPSKIAAPSIFTSFAPLLFFYFFYSPLPLFYFFILFIVCTAMSTTEM